MEILLEFAQLVDSETLFSEIKLIMYKNSIFGKFEEMCDISRSEMIILKDKKNDGLLTEIKTHTLNILRALFKHSQLGDAVTEYISHGFKVAMRSYDGKSWAVKIIQYFYSQFKNFLLQYTLLRIIVKEDKFPIFQFEILKISNVSSLMKYISYINCN